MAINSVKVTAWTKSTKPDQEDLVTTYVSQVVVKYTDSQHWTFYRGQDGDWERVSGEWWWMNNKDWREISYTWTTNPSTSQPWTENDVDTWQFGILQWASISYATACKYLFVTVSRTGGDTVYGLTENGSFAQAIAVPGETPKWECLMDSSADNYVWYTQSGGLPTGAGLMVVQNPISVPIVTTSPCTERTAAALKANGSIASTGGSNCTRRGFAYKKGTTGDPNINDDSVEYEDGSYGTGDFSLDITGLDLGEPYRVRAYATNPIGTGYGTTVDSTISSYPSDTVARVSSIRRVYQPGLYRMEVGVGELGFDVEVSEAAIKRVTDEVTEPDEPDEKDEALQEQIQKVLSISARRERDVMQARQQTLIQEQADRPSVFPELPFISKLPTIPKLLKEPTPTNILAALSPVAIGRTVYEVGKNLVNTLLKGLFG